MDSVRDRALLIADSSVSFGFSLHPLHHFWFPAHCLSPVMVHQQNAKPGNQS